MRSAAPHISFPVFLAALQASRLSWILEHAGQITMGLEYEIKVCRLIAAQGSEQLEKASAEWMVGFAERVAGLCDERGLGR